MEVRGHRLKGNKKKGVERPMGQLKEGRQGLVMGQGGRVEEMPPRGAHTKTREKREGCQRQGVQ